MISLAILLGELHTRLNKDPRHWTQDPNLWLISIAVLDIYLLWGIDKVFF